MIFHASFNRCCCKQPRLSCTDACEMVLSTAAQRLMCASCDVKLVLSLLYCAWCMLCVPIMPQDNNEPSPFKRVSKQSYGRFSWKLLGDVKSERLPLGIFMNSRFWMARNTPHAPRPGPALALLFTRTPSACPAADSTRKGSRKEEEEMPKR